MDINRDIQSHFKKYVKYITPRGVIFYNYSEYNNYMKQDNEDEKKYKTISDDETSKK
jgi:hypothetical protein